MTNNEENDVNMGENNNPYDLTPEGTYDNYNSMKNDIMPDDNQFFEPDN